jgi:hypothetical protein
MVMIAPCFLVGRSFFRWYLGEVDHSCSDILYTLFFILKEAKSQSSKVVPGMMVPVQPHRDFESDVIIQFSIVPNGLCNAGESKEYLSGIQRDELVNAGSMETELSQEYLSNRSGSRSGAGDDDWIRMLESGDNNVDSDEDLWGLVIGDRQRRRSGFGSVSEEGNQDRIRMLESGDNNVDSDEDLWGLVIGDRQRSRSGFGSVSEEGNQDRIRMLE